MRKKEEWMRVGNAVMALGKVGIITKMQENRIGDVDYVYYIFVRLNGERKAGTYHPSDINEIVI